MQTASDTVCKLANCPEFERTEERTLELNNKALEARVQAVLEANPKTREADVDLRADGSSIYLTGNIAHGYLKEEIIEAVSGTRGVKEVIDQMTKLQ